MPAKAVAGACWQVCNSLASKRSIIPAANILAVVAPCQALVNSDYQVANLGFAWGPGLRGWVGVTNRAVAGRVGVDLRGRALSDQIIKADVVVDEMDGAIAEGE